MLFILDINLSHYIWSYIFRSNWIWKAWIVFLKNISTQIRFDKLYLIRSMKIQLVLKCLNCISYKHIYSDQIWSNYIWIDLIISDQIYEDPVGSKMFESYFLQTYLFRSDLINLYLNWSHYIWLDLMKTQLDLKCLKRISCEHVCSDQIWWNYIWMDLIISG